MSESTVSQCMTGAVFVETRNGSSRARDGKAIKIHIKAESTEIEVTVACIHAVF